MDNNTRRFIPSSAVDGDTLRTNLVDLGYHTAKYQKVEYRLLGVNCPESNKAASKLAGLAAKAFTVAWIAEHLHGGIYLNALTVKVPGDDGQLTLTDSFGRYIATISCYLHEEHGSLNQALLDAGHAVVKVY
jgi:endonuclease YncB( thermonuclease family)